ncbi:MAG: 5'-methylthioadenosine/adenosylhomocysteine nucleosidase [Sulfuricurvum sp.]|jgi:adenosylhomocysteine/aminodeoxyfutalosine nucleosidase|uniref:5'-methylthioadenosine/adenosylhomocysteine nucleosidase n=1 Tax=Sulfuricurvum sp. TaxID=2025608 RepID=UPI0025D4FB85|nr:5'-methylthioadenosine/adenosylhomocysteine nucleosidase [Sulfuricurvum sp.]MCK9373828.1 5'-methylthioadenosine/adenosylhomocysteine nucleosidase [Sulfuricurvum sp.]
MKIAIMGAMLEEVEPFLEVAEHEPLLEYFKKHTDTVYGGNIYHEAKYKGLDIVLAYSKIGKVNAGLTASMMIEKFGAEMLLFSGVAGAVNPQLKIGDLIAATHLCQHDLDITAFGHPHGFVPEGKVYVEPSQHLLHIAKEVADEKGINLKGGIIATGDQFIADPERKEWIQKTFEADAIEMEGAAVAVICDALNVPFFVLRAISDTADTDATFDFDEFLKHSSKVSSSFILAMIDKISDDYAK